MVRALLPALRKPGEQKQLVALLGVASTLPSASTVRLCWRRPLAIGAVAVTWGVAPLMSMARASVVELPPPATRILPMSYSTWLP